VIFQVLIRARASALWSAYSSPSNDPFHVVLLIQSANQQYAEVTVIQAEHAAALADLLRQVRGGHLPAEAASPLPGLTTTPRVHVEEPAMERRRWELERGPGGDRDVPYTFTLPRNMDVLAAWMRLLARRWREAHRDEVAA
jgi:hypothetical protein